MAINNNAPRLKSTKNQNRRAALGRPAIKITGGGGGWGGGGWGVGGGGVVWLELVCGRPTLALASVFVHQTKQLRSTQTKRVQHRREAKRAAGIEGQVASML